MFIKLQIQIHLADRALHISTALIREMRKGVTGSLPSLLWAESAVSICNVNSPLVGTGGSDNCVENVAITFCFAQHSKFNSKTQGSRTSESFLADFLARRDVATLPEVHLCGGT